MTFNFHVTLTFEVQGLFQVFRSRLELTLFWGHFFKTFHLIKETVEDVTCLQMTFNFHVTLIFEGQGHMFKHLDHG